MITFKFLMFKVFKDNVHTLHQKHLYLMLAKYKEPCSTTSFSMQRAYFWIALFAFW